MSKLSGAIHDIHSMDELALLNSPIHRIHPLIKLVVTLSYVFIVVSFNKYDLSGLVFMIIFLISMYILGDISFFSSIKKLKIILPICIFLGIFNPFFDKVIIFNIGELEVTSGMVSGLTLIIKGMFSVLASYLLFATTGIEKICYALRIIHIPKIIVTQLLLTYRYITVLLTEANNIYQAYSLRAPKQKGVHYKVWGSLLGQLLLRSIDRANDVYESMLLRGYNGEFNNSLKRKFKISDFLFLIIWLGIFYITRFTIIFEFIGKIFT